MSSNQLLSRRRRFLDSIIIASFSSLYSLNPCLCLCLLFFHVSVYLTITYFVCLSEAVHPLVHIFYVWPRPSVHLSLPTPIFYIFFANNILLLLLLQLSLDFERTRLSVVPSTTLSLLSFSATCLLSHSFSLTHSLSLSLSLSHSFSLSFFLSFFSVVHVHNEKLSKGSKQWRNNQIQKRKKGN